MDSTTTKVVLVTGGSCGIGAGIAKSFSKQGVRLSLVSLDEDKFEDLIEECKSIGAKEVLKIVTELTVKENMEMVMKKTIDTFGRLDVLVNNVGITSSGSIRNVTLENYDKVMSINVRTPLYMTKLAIPHLEKTKGNIVNISSIFSTICTATGALSYGISKGAVDRLTKITALDLADSGIRVNAVNPSYTDTRIMELIANIKNSTLEEIQLELGTQQPLNKRLIKVEEVADAVLFLTSEKAAMITGITLPVDGGKGLTS